MIKAVIFDWVGVLSDGALELVDSIDGPKKYVFSNLSRESAQRIRESVGDVFDGLFFSGETGYIKPDGEAFGYVLENMGLTADECLFVDDSESNIQVAKEMGFNTVLYQSMEQLRYYLLEKGFIRDNQ